MKSVAVLAAVATLALASVADAGPVRGRGGFNGGYGRSFNSFGYGGYSSGFSYGYSYAPVIVAQPVVVQAAPIVSFAAPVVVDYAPAVTFAAPVVSYGYGSGIGYGYGNYGYGVRNRFVGNRGGFVRRR